MTTVRSVRCRELFISSALFLAPLFIYGDGTEPSPAASSEASPYDKQINLVYTVNNFGYTDTCG